MVPEAGPALESLASQPGIDILSPMGELLVNQREVDEEMACSQIEEEYETLGITAQPSTQVSTPYTLEGDVEDVIAAESPSGKNVTPQIMIDSIAVSKPKALRQRFLHRTTRASTDRLKRVQHLPCFNDISDTTNLISFDSALGQPSIRVGNLIASLVICEEMIFLVVGQVNRISFGSHGDVAT